MTQAENRPFQVIETAPADQRANVPLNSVIKIKLSMAADTSTVNESTVIVARNSTTPIVGHVGFDSDMDGNFVITFTPQVVLEAGTNYLVTLVGYSNPYTGGTTSVIKDIIGRSLSKNYHFVFSTGLVDPHPPVLTEPVTRSSIHEDRPEFEWATVTGASEYQIEIGTTSLMNPLYLPEGSTESYPIAIPGTDNKWQPSTAFERGQEYYWRMRSNVGGIWSQWSPNLGSFFILDQGESTPYIPDQEFIPSGDPWRLLTGNEPFQVIGVDPPPNSVNIFPTEFKIYFNKPIDPDSLDGNNVQICGAKLLQSDHRYREPGCISALSVAIDPEAPNVLVVSTDGSGEIYRRTNPVLDSIKIYINRFKDIMNEISYNYAFAKHFHDVADRREGYDNLYTDIQISELRMANAAPFSVSSPKETQFIVESPVNMQAGIVRFEANIPDDTQLDLFVSNDGGLTWAGVPYTYMPDEDDQVGTFTIPLPGSSIAFRVRMSTSDAGKTPTMNWFLVAYNEV